MYHIIKNSNNIHSHTCGPASSPSPAMIHSRTFAISALSFDANHSSDNRLTPGALMLLTEGPRGSDGSEERRVEGRARRWQRVLTGEGRRADGGGAGCGWRTVAESRAAGAQHDWSGETLSHARAYGEREGEGRGPPSAAHVYLQPNG